jgi:hypothetical protein
MADPDPYPAKPPAHLTEEWLAGRQAQYPQLASKKVLALPGRITRLKGHEDFIELIAPGSRPPVQRCTA